MKVLKILGLIVVSFILVNCDNSKPAANNSTTDTKAKTEQSAPQSTNDDYSKSQDLVISEVKKQLPVDVDELTTLVDISKTDNIVNYKYSVNGTSKDVLLLPEGQKIMRDTLLDMYCSDSPEIKELKSIFPSGANYSYYINDEHVLTLQITPADCNAQ